MSSGKRRKRAQELLEIPFRYKKSRSPSPSPCSILSPGCSNTATNAPDTAIVVSGSLVRTSSGTGEGTTDSNTLPDTAHTTWDQSLNSQSPTTSLSVKNTAFQQAIQKYIDNLSDNDKVAFRSATDIIEALGQLQKGKSCILSSHTTRVQKVHKLLQCVKHFLGSIAICIQHSPEISSLVVGGLNCILTLALGYIEFFESLTDMMERIGDHLIYLSKYSIAFQDSEEVQQALVSTYCDLLDFYIKVRNLFTHKEGKLSYAQGFKRFLRITWEPFEVEFRSIETRFIHHANIVVRLAGAESFYQRETRDKQRQAEEKLNKGRRKILEWLSPDDFQETHDRHCKKRFQGTGQWLLNDPHFISWRDEPQSRLLWCYGAPGSGKTILASLVIDYLLAYHELSTDIGVTFIYCNYTESHSPREYIRSAIKQLCRGMISLPPKLNKVYEQHYKNHSQPGLQELQDIFLATVQQFGSVFLVLDALDECTLDQRADLYGFFTSIIELGTGTAGLVKLFVASREEPDIERAFLRKSFPTIKVEAKKVDSDIELYVTAQIEQLLHDGSLTLNNIILKDKILTALTVNSGGMFLWVELQLKAICAQVSDYGIEETLENIPKDIDATYERILDIIDKKPPAQRELARRALLFVAYAREPVSIDCLALAIAVKDYTQSLDMLRSSVSTERTILNACANLLSIDDTDSGIRHACFIHFSVHEFLTSRQSKLLHTLSLEYEVAHREIARMCMSFLLILYSQIQDYCLAAEGSFANNYILHALPHHLLAGNLNSLPLNDGMISLTSRFFERGPPMLASHYESDPSEITFFTFSPSVFALIFNLPGAHQRYNPQVLYEKKQLDQRVLTWVHNSHSNFVRVSDNRFAMHYATSQLDCVAVCQRLYAHGYPIQYSYHRSDGPLNTFNTWGLRELVPDICQLTPLYLVKGVGVASFLLDKSPVNPQVVNEGSPNLLGHIAKGGNTKVIQLLLDSGAEQDKEAQSIALQCLAYDGKVEAMQLLLDKGADINAPGGLYGNALQAAAYNDNIEAMQLLLDKGADVNVQGGLYGNSLQVAAYNGNIEAVHLLLDNGANINAQGGEYDNALQAAVYRGNLKAIELLLNEGADVNAHGGKHGGALQAAAYHGDVHVLQLLLDRGVNVNTQGGSYGNALQVAAYNDNIGAMQFLLNKGANVNAQGGEYGNALQAAAYSGKVEAMRLLLNQGANVNAQGGEYGNALQAAAKNADIDAMQLLLDEGADIHVQDEEYGNPLQIAAYNGNVRAIKFLLDKGADVNAQGGEYGSALQAAAYNGNVDAMGFLLSQGADVNAQGGRYDSALQAAAYHGNIEAIWLLLDNGAEVNAQGGHCGTALQAAAYHGSVGAMQLLLDAGADVDEQGGKYGTAFQAAECNDNFKAMELLLDRGADSSA